MPLGKQKGVPRVNPFGAHAAKVYAVKKNRRGRRRKKDTARRVTSLMNEGAIAVTVPIAWAAMAFRRDDSGAFSGMGLRYFAALSNLLTGLAALPNGGTVLLFPLPFQL